jgi:hypothetical protein
MQKGRIFERLASIVGILLVSFLVCQKAAAQQPSVDDVVEAAKLSKMRDYSKSLSDIYKSAAPVAATPTPPPPPGANPSRVPAVPSQAPVLETPVLRAIFGVNQTLEAELVFDGQSYSVYSDESSVEIGQWTYGRVFQGGVLLARAPFNQIQSAIFDSALEQKSDRLLSCGKLGLKKSHCLVLLTGKASSGVGASMTSGSMRGAFPAPGLPPMQLPR